MRRASDLEQFEGLIVRTSQMYSARVGLELEDMQQVLRIKVWQAVGAFSDTRSKMTLETYVFSCVTNKVKDLKRDAARRRNRGTECYIEDIAPRQTDRTTEATRDRFDARYLAEAAERVFAAVEDSFDLPSTLTETERQVVTLLALDFAQKEIALLLQIPRADVSAARSRVEEKMADWRPTPADQPLPIAA